MNNILTQASNLIKKWVEEQHQEQKILIEAEKIEDVTNQALQLKNAENNVLSAARRMSTTLESMVLFIQKVLSAFFPSSQLCQKFACGAQDLVSLKAGRVDPGECISSLKCYLPNDDDILLDGVKDLKLEKDEEVKGENKGSGDGKVEDCVDESEKVDNGEDGDQKSVTEVKVEEIENTGETEVNPDVTAESL